MTEAEKYWISVCYYNTKDYVIVVDNDSAYVDDLNSGECVFTFKHYGWKLALELFRYIGCNAEEA